MGKTVAFVICYSICLCGLFITFTYLLSTLEPRKLQHEYTLEDSHDLDKTKERQGTYSGNVEQKENKQLIRHAFYSDIKNISDSVTEDSRMAALVSASVNSTVAVNKVIDLESTADLNKSVNAAHSAGFRRSVDLPNTANDTESVIMKIIDEDGYPKIEIKISKKRRKKNKSQMKKNVTYQTLHNNSINVVDGVTKNIVTNLLTNNSIVDDKNGNWKNVTSIFGSNNITLKIKAEDEFVPTLTTEAITTSDYMEMFSANTNITATTAFSLVLQDELNKTIDVKKFAHLKDVTNM